MSSAQDTIDFTLHSIWMVILRWLIGLPESGNAVSVALTHSNSWRAVHSDGLSTGLVHRTRRDNKRLAIPYPSALFVYATRKAPDSNIGWRHSFNQLLSFLDLMTEHVVFVFLIATSLSDQKHPDQPPTI
jgi:hypothetical protein